MTIIEADMIEAATETLARAADEIAGLARRARVPYIAALLSDRGRTLTLHPCDSDQILVPNASVRVLFPCRSARTRKGTLVYIDQWATKQHARLARAAQAAARAESARRHSSVRHPDGMTARHTSGTDGEGERAAQRSDASPSLSLGPARRQQRRRSRGRRAPVTARSTEATAGQGGVVERAQTRPLTDAELARFLAAAAKKMGLVGDPHGGYRSMAVQPGEGSAGPRRGSETRGAATPGMMARAADPEEAYRAPQPA